MEGQIKQGSEKNVSTEPGKKEVSWVKIAQEKKVLKKYDLRIEEMEDGKAVEIPDEVIEKADLLWDDYLIGKFLDTAPHVARVHATVNRIWNQGGQKQLIDVQVVDDTTMKFKVQNPMMRARIVKRGMWNIGNVPLVVTKWTPDELKEKPEVKSIPMWVYLKNVPMNMFSWQGLSFIVSAAGFPVRLHSETSSCSNFKLAKIFVNVDLTKELPDKINFTKNGKSSLVEFIYPWLPLRCRTCGKWGHAEKVCAINKDEGFGTSVVQTAKGETEKKESETEKGEEKKEMSSKKGETNKEVTKEVEVEEGEMVEKWQDVTPEKASRSSNLQFGQVKILTPSRFSNLLDVDEKGETIEEETEEIPSVVEEITNAEIEEIPNAEIEEILNAEIEEIPSVVEEKMEKDTEREKDKEKKEESNEEKMDSEDDSKESQHQGIAGIKNTLENWPDLASASKIRPSLPRKSKTLHRVVQVPEKPGNRGTKQKPF